MTKNELRKIFDDAEKEICTSELYEKIRKELSETNKAPAESAEGLAIRVNRIVDREILVAVLLKVLGDK